MSESFRIAVIGQSAFSANFLKELIAKNYTVAGVFTIQDDKKTGREDVLATTAKELQLPVFKIQKWRNLPETEKAIPEVLEIYKSVNADLNVLPFCGQFIPMDIINMPKFKTINYHPSLLPKHRGAASINWTLIHGDDEAGFSIFWADDGLDTGPILMKRSCFVRPEDTVDSLYSRFLFPEGIKALVESVGLIKSNQAPKIIQPEEGASYEPILRGKEDRSLIDFNSLNSSDKLHNFIRGMDKVPGAWTRIKITSEDSSSFRKVRLFGSTLYDDFYDYGEPDVIRKCNLEGLSREAIIHAGGMLIYPNNSPNAPINIDKIQFMDTGKMIPASLYGSPEADKPPLELTELELTIQERIRDVWQSILPVQGVTKSTDFFDSGGGSMDVVRLVEEVMDIGNSTGPSDELVLESQDVYMAKEFQEFVEMVIRKLRGEGANANPLNYEPVVVEANNMRVSFPNQLFINNKFVDSISGKTMDILNPTDESRICQVQMASRADVDKAVKAARIAFDERSAWRQLNARDRGQLLYKLAKLMEENQKELATIESLDSGAVYTLALKTHIGMSIQAISYFAGWCDKIHGKTIPINNSRPNKNFTWSKRRPIGVCGLITPWNYPLMMVCWKAGAALAAGNTIIIKPAQYCPLAALKWAELVARAGFPPGVVNILPGRGSDCGQAMLEHNHISKIGFTGSSETGKDVMKTAADQMKRLSLELGGKSPLIIFGDCDLKRAVKDGMSSAFFNKGENCIAAGRIFVEQNIYDEYIEMVLEETKKIVIGDPLKRSTAHGPQNHLAHLQSLEKFCSKGVSEGAKLLYGGYRLTDRKGYFFHPTIFVDVEDHMFIAREESFGPIMIISKFKNDDVNGVIKRANRTIYGLCSGVFTQNIDKAMEVSDRLCAGTCFINTYNKTDVAAPFGGFKYSGFGKDLGKDALKEYTETKVVTLQF